ncbi:amino acid/amide ABC transporter membrane protein 1, HAAT family [Octadecabacter temperatus]|uniref:High-affinity branched-chain amino acid transport system permease protein LivH n=1 Tax=Octadecabacter temperatus TaxID=1458307 RepID=A0A0K0Y1X5_9RHOB|nr:urea ABC transporter permease subunit UrtB [Octadecabacter temperatus]AKS44935.1 High-affinity branched-chain amino acid transport system permease protein LivH [Octadecabacter temperatus]SIN83005.1 amino acid/amide ABC transporter membrane protein 1, HAAT family [Octadecabacter temperatus]
MLRLLFACLSLCLVLVFGQSVQAQSLQDVLQDNAEAVAKPSRRTVDDVIAALVASSATGIPDFLEGWRAKEIWQRDADGLFFRAVEDGDGLILTDLDTAEVTTVADDDGFSQAKPNAGVRRVISSALVQFLLSDPDITRRQSALDAIGRDPSGDQLEPLRASIDGEPDAEILARKQQLERQLTAQFDEDPSARVAAINDLSGDVSVEVRGVVSQILTTRQFVASSIPNEINVARILEIGEDLTEDEAYQLLVDADLADATVAPEDIVTVLTAQVVDGHVAGVDVSTLDTDGARVAAYQTLADRGDAPPFVTPDAQVAAMAAHTFYLAYVEPDATITGAAKQAQDAISTQLAVGETLDLTLDGLSLASIYFLAAIGLAITFGVMGVINMAHGEFIMMGAYTGYVVQQIVPDYTLSIIIALPAAFAVTFAAGVAMERLVIRHLYHRPLETLLATFGIAIVLQQLAKNIFGTQARPLTSPDWLAGAWVVNDVIQISYIRIAIFVLALLFLGLILFILKRTRLGLEVRAVTQNPGMAASMGINPDRINMLTFGLGSGIAGIAGVAIGLYAKVTSEMGADYIVQSFMTVVVGGVGNVWGTLAGASLIGFTQKGIEWFNPSNTLAAQTYMILFVILFIQFRPKGIVALKGRAAGD